MTEENTTAKQSDSSPPRAYKLMVVAGETSGDMHAADVAKALKTTCHQCELIGMGLDAMRKAGVRLLVDARRAAVVGLLEIFKNIIHLYTVYRRMEKNLQQEKPDLLIVVDYPGFNLRLAKRAHALGIKVLYYIGPKVWAWKAGRIKTIRACVSSMAVIFPYEEDIYRRAGVPVHYVGHPLVEQYQPPPAGLKHERKAVKNILLLPGSREVEIDKMLPLLCDAAHAIKEQTTAVRFSVLCAPNIGADKIAKTLARKNLRCELLECSPWHAMHQADCAIAAAGTASLQLALCEKPMLVIYKTSWFNYILLRQLVKVPYISLVNLIAGKQVVKEYIQHQATADNISAEIVSLLRDQQRYKKMQDELRAVKKKLGGRGAAQRTAQLAKQLLMQSQQP